MLIYWGVDASDAEISELAGLDRCLVTRMPAGCNEFETACGKSVRHANLDSGGLITCTDCQGWMEKRGIKTSPADG